LVLREIIKTVATRCHIFKLKCTKFDFGAGGAYSAPSDPLAGCKGAYFQEKGMEGGGKDKGGGEKEGGRGGDLLIRRGGGEMREEGERRVGPKPKKQTSPVTCDRQTDGQTTLLHV